MLGGMDINRTALERAFDLACSGQVETVDEIKKKLRREGYDLGQIFGQSLMRQPRELIDKAREDANRV